MDSTQLNWIANFIWGIADDVLRDIYVRGKYRDVILSVAAKVMSRPVDRMRGHDYTRIGLYNRGRGIFHKPSTDGALLGDSDFTWIEDGDLVISGQFAWEGAVALARLKDAGCVASHRYPILRGRQGVATSAVLLAVLRTPYGALLLDHHSRGAAGRNRPLNARTFLKEKFPIPPQSEHKRISQLPQSIDSEIPVRGATAFGDFELGESIFVGKAIDEAASWHEQSDWIGVHLTPSAEYVFNPITSKSAWTEFCPPHKAKLNWTPHCVDWTKGWNDRVARISEIKTKFRRLGPIVPEIAPKLVNTLAFIDAVKPTKAKRKNPKRSG